MSRLSTVALALALTGALVLAPAVIVTAPASAVPPEGCSQTAVGGTVTCLYLYTGTEAEFRVPVGVTELSVELVGGAGGGRGAAGGRGALVSGTLGVTSNTRLFIAVGGNGQENAGGFNGGGLGRPYSGGGGGASDIRTVPRTNDATTSLDSRLVVAAGGGGAGYFEAGADAGADAPGAGFITDGARAGSQSAGGAGASDGMGSADPGAIGRGGDARDGGAGAGGGGAGLYGGGAGYFYTPGAGGSSLVPAGGSSSPSGAQASVSISYTPTAANAVTLEVDYPSTLTAGEPFAVTAYTVDSIGSRIADVTSRTSFTLAGVPCTANVCSGPWGYQVLHFSLSPENLLSFAVVRVDARLPGAPTGVTATPGDGTASVTFQAPADLGNPAASSYRVTAQPGGAYCDTAASSCTVTGLANGTSHTFTVAGRGAAGFGANSAASAAVTPRGVPGAPVVSVQPGNMTVGLTWTAQANGSAITGYLVEWRETSSSNWNDFEVPSSPTELHGLVNGQSYTFRVSATNGVGTGPTSAEISATPRRVPLSPGLAPAVPGDGTVSLTWTAPQDGGSPLTGYRVSYREVGTIAWIDRPTTQNLTDTVPNLINGTAYEFQVRASNAAGLGSSSMYRQATPRTLPDAPTSLSASPGDASASLTWTAPTGTGGAPVAVYQLRHRPVGAATWIDDPAVSGPSATVSGLVNGTTYEFQVRAVNAAGAGGWSGSATTVPRTQPSVPGVTAVPRDAGADLSWAAPADGGASLSGYELRYRPEGGPAWIAASGTASTTATVGGLLNGTAYEFQVRAVNVAGPGQWSSSATATPFLFSPRVVDGRGAPVAGATLLPGDTVEVWASGLPVGAVMTVVLHSDPVVLGSAVVDATGAVRLSSRIPLGTAGGTHELVASLTGTGAPTTTRSVQFTVDAGAGLAHTGDGPDGGAALAGLTLIALGGLALLRRRRFGRTA